MKPGDIVKLRQNVPGVRADGVGLWNVAEGHLKSARIVARFTSSQAGMILALMHEIESNHPSVLLLVEGRLGWQMTKYFEDASAVDTGGG